MEAASAVPNFAVRLRARRRQEELLRLRRAGEAYVLRRFSGQLDHADAEDVVAEALARLHQRLDEGHVPDNLRAMFFTAARNAAIDLLRARRVRPTAPLEVAAAAPDRAAGPVEQAESHDDSARLQEALARMRGNYREAIMLRFGLGLTVPEIAERMGISLPAAKKLMIRATRQAKQRLLAVDGRDFCSEMQQLARGSLAERRAGGMASEAEVELLRVHVAHCGTCRTFLAKLHEGLHELGSAALASVFAGERLGAVSVPQPLAAWIDTAAGGLHAGLEKARIAAFRASGALSPGEGAAGALAGTGQKVAAICATAGAATAACVVGGAIGPTIGPGAPMSEAAPREHRAAELRPAPLPAPSPEPVEAQPPAAAQPPPETSEPSSSDLAPSAQPAQPAAASPPASVPAPQEPPPTEFGIEGSAPRPTPSSSEGDSGSPAAGGGEAATPTAPPSRSEVGGGGVGFQG